MTEKHKAAISRGIRKLRKRRNLSAAMIASWKRRRTENAPEVRNSNHITPVQFDNDVQDHLISRIVDLVDENNRYRELFAKLQNTLK